MMWVPMRISLLLLLLVPFLISCLGIGEDRSDGIIAMAVRDARRPAALKADVVLPDILTVTSFRVVISGDGIVPPIEVFFPGDSSSGIIKGIPKGRNRKVLIEALNAGGIAVRRREVDNVEISGGGDPTPVEASLLSVPVLTSPSNNALVVPGQLVFHGYAEPAGTLEIMETTDNASVVLYDVSTAADMVSPSLSDGGFTFQPSVMGLGQHSFTVRDPQSGWETQVAVTLVPPGRQPGTGFSAGGLISKINGSALGSLSDAQDVRDEISQ